VKPQKTLSVCLSLASCLCGTAGAAQSVRDSAGVEIREGLRPLSASVAWRISSNASVTIGAEDGPVANQFARISGATRFDDGSVAVADETASNVRIFDAAGRLIRTVGRNGAGPGEFRVLRSLRRVARDSVALFDNRQNRVTVIDRSGKILIMRQLPTTRYSWMYPLPNGRWMASEEEGTNGTRLREDATPGLHRFPTTVLVLDSAGAVVDTVGVFPGAEQSYRRVDGRLGTVSSPYGRVLSLASRDGQAYVATGDFLGYDVYTASGKHLRSIRAAGPDRTLRASEVAAYNDALLAQIPNQAQRDAYSRFLKGAEAPRQKAAVSRILLDPLGGVWLSGYETEFLPAAVWHVFDSRHRYVGAIPIPTGLRILEIGPQHVVGIWTDDSGVQSVRVHALAR